jgi:ubiquinone/menaquinone biosynthesis C-methylase UbiE
MPIQEARERQRLQSNLDFRIMSLSFKIRDVLRPRVHILEEASIKTCFQVLDYGCSPGSYIIPVIKLISNIGMLYALDVNPLAIKAVQKLASKKRVSNVRVILSDCDTGLPPASVDVVLLYDILHDLENRAKVLTELHRVLKPEGILSVSDHHLEEDEIISRVIKGGLFKFKSKGKRTLSFSKDKR